MIQDITDKEILECYGPKLYEEVDPQEWQKIVQLAGKLAVGDPSSFTHPWLHDSYLCEDGYGYWKDVDLIAMSSVPVPVNVVEPPIKNKTKTRIQITLKKKGKNIKGHSGNFVVHAAAADVVSILSDLSEHYPKVEKPNDIVRVQITQYGFNGYQYYNGYNINLHNADSSNIMVYVTSKLIRAGFKRFGRGWIKSSTSDKIDDINLVNKPYDKQLHKGMWCVCSARDGHSWVVGVYKSEESIIPNVCSRLTYILDPIGNFHRIIKSQ